MKRILALAHRSELIYQMAATGRDSGLSVGIEMGSHRAGKCDVVVSTIQTQVAWGKCRVCLGTGEVEDFDEPANCQRCDGRGQRRRMEAFDPDEFGLVIIDEAHHATAKTYRLVQEYFGRNKSLKFLMVTATPKRSDKVGLHNVCDSVAYEMELREAISEGWLVPIRQKFVTVDSLDLSKVGTKNDGDLKDGERERAFLGETTEEEEELLHSIAKPTIDTAEGKQVLLIAAGCEHAQKLCAACNAYDGVTAELVLGTTDKDERKRIVERFRSGETQILVGVDCFNEGFDAPDTYVVAIAKPTKAQGRYLQMIGRGTRPLSGLVDGVGSAEDRKHAIAQSEKPHCVILDFVGNSGRHKLVSVADVLAGDSCDPVDLDAALSEAKTTTEPVDMEELIEKNKQAREEREERARQREEERKRQSTRHRADKAEYTSQDVDIFSGRRFDPFTDYKPKPWQATKPQCKLLQSMGVDPETAMNYSKAQAGKVISELKRTQVGGKFRMPFGKHRGTRLENVPGGYLRWLMTSGAAHGELLKNIQVMQGQHEPEPELAGAPF